jgi:hypothetical protein
MVKTNTKKASEKTKTMNLDLMWRTERMGRE